MITKNQKRALELILQQFLQTNDYNQAIEDIEDIIEVNYLPTLE